jgi:phosphatidylglycerophosphatase C
MDSANDAAIPRTQADEILARLHVEAERLPGGVIASDADGTIWDGDVGYDLFETLLAERAVREEAREALLAEAREHGIAVDGDANAVTQVLFDAHNDGRYPHDRAFAMMAWAFAGWRRDELRAFCERVLDQRGLMARVRPGLRAVFAWAKDHGVEAYVVSASPIEMVHAAVERARLGIGPDRVVAMTPAADERGVIQPRLAGPVVYGEGKLYALEGAREGARRALIAAFGDSAYDAAMLRAARIPVAVTPAPPLRALAHTIPGLVMLDR